MTDREKTIAEIRSKSYPGRVVSVHAGTVHDLLSDIRFLLSELERKDREISECQELYAAMESMWYEAMQELDREREENQKLCEQLQSAQQEREKLIDALQTIRTDTEDPYTSEFAKKTLKQIGVTVDV
jgi:chromosome segregation ATPase